MLLLSLPVIQSVDDLDEPVGDRLLAKSERLVELAPPPVRLPRERYVVEIQEASPEEVYDVLLAPPVAPVERRYTLQEIQQTENLRAYMPRVDLNTITFDTGSWEIPRA